jgi:Holliday junction resolvasome RuvABC ATP-dependent DNA helicase subunit
MIGQEKIFKELSYISPQLEKGTSMNILLVAPSGYGKTSLGFYLLWFSHGNFWYYLPEKGEVRLHENKKFHFIDEIHTLDSFEWLYPLMDSEKYVFIFATNEYGDLPEPLWRRCIRFIFEPYTDEQIKFLVLDFLAKSDFIISENLAEKIASVCRRNPGVTKTVCQRLSYVFARDGIPDEERLENILNEVLGIKNKLTELDMRYLAALKILGQASLDRISIYSRIPKTVVLRDIEPYLLEQGIISVGSRGRKLMEDQNELRS